MALSDGSSVAGRPSRDASQQLHQDHPARIGFVPLTTLRAVEIMMIRHAEPDWVVGGVNQADPGLTARGHRQADLLAERIGRLPVTDVVSSGARRALETAAPLATALGVEVEVVPDLEEIRVPDWGGTPGDAVVAAIRAAYLRPPAEWWDGFPGGESFRAFHDRITSTLVALLAARDATPHPGPGSSQLWDAPDGQATTLIVAHAGTNAVALGHLLGVEPAPWEWERFALRHASIVELATFPLGAAFIFSLRSLNDVEHLPADLRTR